MKSNLICDLQEKFNLSFLVNLFNTKQRTLRYTTVNRKKLTLKDGIFDANIIYHKYKTEGIIVFDKPITRIGELAFCECNDLAEITIPDRVTTIENRAFCMCNNLKQVNLSKNLTTLGYNTFAGCNKLRHITIPDSVTELGSGCFYECENLIKVIIGEGVTSIEDRTFYCCHNLKWANIPESVTQIKRYAFNGCALERITIPDSVCSIEEGAFRYCDKLEVVTIGKNITDIGMSAFAECEKVKELYCNAVTPPYLSATALLAADMWSGNLFPICDTIYVPTKSVNAYKQASGWSELSEYIKANPYR